MKVISFSIFNRESESRKPQFLWNGKIGVCGLVSIFHSSCSVGNMLPTEYAQQWLYSESLHSWTAEGGHRLLLTPGVAVGLWNLEQISTFSIKFHFKIQTRSGFMLCVFFFVCLFHVVPLPPSLSPGKSHASNVLTWKC